MISRRLLRIKVLQVLYAYYKSDAPDLKKSEKELFFSIRKSYDLYFYLLLLVIDICDYAESRIELARNKKIPSYEDLHPNTRFIENALLNQLRENGKFRQYIETEHISWVTHPEFIKELYNEMLNMDEYREYMETEEFGYPEEKKFIQKLFTDLILPSDSLLQILEEKSIYWNDDLEFVMPMILKTIKKFTPEKNRDENIMDLYKSDEDREFVLRLFRKSIVFHDMSVKLIEEKASNWDLDRIAFMDLLIMQLAITEMMEFESIPTKVSINEYLEIAKFYSTEKSNTFINGVLDKIMQQLKSENKIKKSGRGLIGEI